MSSVDSFLERLGADLGSTTVPTDAVVEGNASTFEQLAHDKYLSLCSSPVRPVRLGVSAAQAVYVGNDMFRDIYGARQVGLHIVMFDSDQGTKEYEDYAPDYRVTDHRELLEIVGISR
jgi:phosphoglycolate phosphatase-like HAD superfamily hydrolase